MYGFIALALKGLITRRWASTIRIRPAGMRYRRIPGGKQVPTRSLMTANRWGNRWPCVDWLDRHFPQTRFAADDGPGAQRGVTRGSSAYRPAIYTQSITCACCATDHELKVSEEDKKQQAPTGLQQGLSAVRAAIGRKSSPDDSAWATRRGLTDLLPDSSSGRMRSRMGCDLSRLFAL